MIAFCGLNCAECPAYTGTTTGDEQQLEKMNQEFGSEETDAVDFVCLGCKYKDSKLIATDCARCTIRMCAMERHKDFCATCEEFETCDRMKPYRRGGETELDKRNALIRAKFYRQN
ncbi:MAG: DUF3795 domain-containing protein [Clostridiales bacterium]|nr:DUF3795 domain-containing protein [Clostridiales bacterium]